MTEPEQDQNTSQGVGTTNFEQQQVDYQQRKANILESFTDAYLEVDLSSTVTYYNSEAERILSMPKTAVVGRNLWEAFANDVPQKFVAEFRKATETNIAVTFEQYLEPKKIWLEVSVFPSGSGLSVYFKDITERKQVVEQLQVERRKYSDLFNMSPLPQWVYEVDTFKFLDVNEAAIIHYGYSKEDFLSMTIKDIRREVDIPILTAISKKLVPGRFSKSIVKHVKKNGEIITVCVEGNSLSFGDKNARLVLAIDRTIELESAEALKESVNRYNVVWKATSDAIWDWDMITGEIIWNQGIKSIFGYPQASYNDEWWQQHVHPDDLDRVLAEYESLTKNRKNRLKIEYRFLCADGSYCFVLDRAFITFNKAGTPIRGIGSMQDISEQKKTLQSLESQNDRLRQINWIQSNKVKNPLVKMLGVITLMSISDTDLTSINEMVPMLKRLTNELDLALKEIAEKSS
jgi:PAS domain S-box-containing protein